MFIYAFKWSCKTNACKNTCIYTVHTAICSLRSSHEIHTLITHKHMLFSGTERKDRCWTHHLDGGSSGYKVHYVRIWSGTFAACVPFHGTLSPILSLRWKHWNTMQKEKVKKEKGAAVALVESSRIPSFLLSARAVQILAQFDMTNHPHRLPDSNTLPARLIHWAGRDEQGVG